MSIDGSNSEGCHWSSPSQSVVEVPPKRRRGGQRNNSNARKHGLFGRNAKALKDLGPRVIDLRSKLGKAVAVYRHELIADLGGIESLSKMELALVDEAIVTRLLLATVNEWLSKQPHLVRGRSRSVIPAVMQRNALVTTLQNLLRDLGLKRRARQIEAPLDEIARDYAARHEAEERAADASTGLAERNGGIPVDGAEEGS